MVDIDKMCMGCMNDIGEEDVCPYCGEKKEDRQKEPFLHKGSILSERYVLGKGLEANGEGLGYVGYDKVKDIKVYIREFYPQKMCEREEGTGDLKILPGYSEMFKRNCQKFLKYFRSVARLRNIDLIETVYDIFEENGTAYIVIEWIEGISLERYVIKNGGHIEWKEARILFMPLLSALARMHSANVKHLGISPVNMVVTPSGKIKLIGFGIEDLRNKNSDLNYQLYEGCAALEQYIEAYETDESTDIYGFTASLFYALTGEYPMPALDRQRNDELLMAQDIVRGIPNNVISAIAGGLRVYPNNRTLSFDRLRAELSNSPSVKIESDTKALNAPPKLASNNKTQNNNNNFMWGVWSCVIALAVLIMCLLVYWFGFKKDRFMNTSDASLDSASEVQPSEESDDKSNKISTPNLVEKNFKKLQEELSKEDSEYVVVILSEEFNDNIGEGCIISQNPTYGSEMTSGGTIAVTVSKGSKGRTLPNVQGKTLSEASIMLSELKFVPIETKENSDTVKEGRVIGYKDHKAGDIVEYGSEVRIIVSAGSK